MKKRQNGFVGITLVILAALLAVGGGAYVYMQTSPYVSSKDQNVTPSVMVESDTDNSVEAIFEEKTTVPAKNEIKTVVESMNKPDLTIEDILIHNTTVTSEKTIGYQQLTAKICNRGVVGINTGDSTRDLEKTSVAFTVNGVTVHSRKSLLSITAGGCDPLVGFHVVELDTAYGPFKGMKSGSYEITAKADPDFKIDESNEQNNSFSKSIYLDLEPTIKKLSITNPTSGAVWKEGNEYVISWNSFGPEVARYFVSIGNYGARTAMGIPATYTQQGIGRQTSLTFKVEKGFGNSMFAGDPKGKSFEDIKNDFYIEVSATDSNRATLGSGRTDTFTIEP